MHWDFVQYDRNASVPAVYDVWRDAGGDVVVVQVHWNENDEPLGFPDGLLSSNLLGSMTIWPFPTQASFLWWHGASSPEK